MRRKGKEKVN